jgi:hypothetical protein
MCYDVYLSTNSPENLSNHNNELVKFTKVIQAQNEPVTKHISHSYKWYVGSKSDCSCTFRHLCSIELGFGEPVDWCEEDDDEINATISLYEVINSLVKSGHQVDCIDIWQGENPENFKNIKTMEVSLRKVPLLSFRLFENHKFIFSE